jgi:hypothetical protein
MATESRFNGAVGAVQEAFRRVAARIAGLSFWQFVLLAIILLAAAGIAENLWDKPAKRRVRITEEPTAGTTEKHDTKAREKEAISAEIRIDQDGVIIRRKATPEDKTAVLSPSPQETEKSVPAAPATGADPGAQDKQTSQRGSEPETKEIRIGKDLVVIRKRKPATASAPGDAKPSEDDVEVSDEDIEEIVLHARQPPLVTITLLMVLALFLMRMFARAQQRAEKKADAALAVADRETLQRQVLEARLQLLQAQVEPHFLFNSLAAVEHLIETAPVRAAKMQRHLIDYLRAAIPRMRQQSATLGQEVELCVSYLEIMQMRMEERLQFKVAVPAGLGSASFPPMMIQSLIENSIRHGLEPKPEGGTIDLTAEVRDGKLCVTVTDTGLGFPPNARTGVGLANIRERLQQLFGTTGALTIEPNLPSGTRATIALPYAVT